MDDIDEFLSSLEQFNAPSITASISALSTQQQPPSQQQPAVQPVSHSEVNQRASETSGREHKRRRREGPPPAEHQQPPHPPTGGVSAASLPLVTASHPAQPSASRSTWSCSRCTLVNKAEAGECAACGQAKLTREEELAGGPSSPPVVVVAEVQCSHCTFLNACTAKKCAMCDALLKRRRHPPPSSAPAPTPAASDGVAAATSAVSPSPVNATSAESNSGNNSKSDGASPLSSASSDDEDDEEEMLDEDDSDDSDATGISDGSDSDDSDGAEGRKREGEKDPLDNRELVKFLQALEAVPFDQLPLAPVPPTMQVKGELKPFQRQALHWLQSQEAGISALDTTNTTNTAEPVKGEEGGGAGLAFVDVDDAESQGAEGACALMRKGHPSVSLRSGGGGGHFHAPPGIPSSSSGRAGVAVAQSQERTRREALQSVRGGILADYMGLGKTRTMIALCESTSMERLRLLRSAVARPVGGVVEGTRAAKGRMERITGSQVRSEATLVVCPTALLRQWASEINHSVDAPAPRVLLYHGSRRKRLSMFDVAEKYDYVLTSYQTLRHENAPRVGGGGAAAGYPNSSPPFRPRSEYVPFSVSETMREAPPGKLFMVEWKRVILDEAHTIRNMRAKMTRACLKLTARHKWAVTATPVQNSLNDLFPLLKFLDVPHFGNLQWWNEEIVHYFNQDPNHQRPVTALRMLFSSLLLRRTPDSVVGGAKILDLPPKEVRTEYVVLSRKEQMFYDAVHASATRKIDAAAQRHREAAAAAAQAGGSRWSQQWHGGLSIAPTPHTPSVHRLTTFSTAFEMLTRCRQTCLHPYIVVAALRRFQNPSTSSGAPAPAEGNALSSLNAVDEERTRSEAAEAAAAARREAEEQRVLTAAMDAFIEGTLRRALAVRKGAEFMRELVEELRRQKLEDRECIICLDRLLHPAILPCGHTYCKDCITHALQVKSQCPMCKRSAHLSKVLVVPVELLRKKGEGEGGGPTSSTSVAAAAASGAGGEKTVDVAAAVANVDVGNLANWTLELSAKTRYLLDALRTIPAEDQVLVFSSFTTYLTYAQHCLDAAGVSNVLYTGALSSKQKDDVVRRFTGQQQQQQGQQRRRQEHAAEASAVATAGDAPAPPRVLLASIAACGVGLNLVSANHCFLMDPVWNPGAEDQALNRIHRIGQTKPVTVVKLIARGTVEEKMEVLNAKKRQLSGYCFAGGSGGGGRLRAEELMALFANDSHDSDEDEDDGDSSSSSSSDVDEELGV